MKSGGSIIKIRQKLNEALKKFRSQRAGRKSLMSQEFTRVMLEAEKLADKANDKYVSLERILQALVMSSGTQAQTILQESGIDAVKLNNAINEYRKGRLADSGSAEDNFEALKKFAIDITAKAKANSIR